MILSNFREINPTANNLRFFFIVETKGQFDVRQNWASLSDEVAYGNTFSIFFHKMLPNRQVLPPKTRDINLKAYFTQKVGSGGDFESETQVFQV